MDNHKFNSIKKTGCFLFGIVFGLFSPAQENRFVVYSCKGNISVLENKTETKAKIGTLLNNESVFKLTSGSLATLICNESKM